MERDEDGRSSPVRPDLKPPFAVLMMPDQPVARTCNLIFIVLDVLKPLGDKAVS